MVTNDDLAYVEKFDDDANNKSIIAQNKKKLSGDDKMETEILLPSANKQWILFGLFPSIFIVTT